MAEKLSVQIELTGGAAVEQQLAGIGKAGSESFQETSKAADQASASVSKFSLQSVAAGASIARSFAGIAKEAVEIGLAFKDQSLAVAAFEKLGIAALGLRGSLGLVVEALGPVGVTMAVATTAAIAAAAAFETLRIAAEKMAKPFEDMNNRLQTLATNSGQSFASLQQGEAAFAQIGISAETFAGTITKIGEILKSFDVGAELQKSADEVAAAIDKALEAEKALLEVQLAKPKLFTIDDPGAIDKYLADLARLREIQGQLNSEVDKEKAAQEALAAARGKVAESAANSLKNVLELVQAIEAGQKGITFDSLTKSEAIIKAVAASLKMAAEDGKDANRVLLEFLAGADRATAVQVGAKFGFSEAQVDLIRRFANELGRLGPTFERVNAAGVLIGPKASASFAALTAAIQNTNAASERLRQAWASSFFARFASDAAIAMEKTKAAVLDFAAATLEMMNRLSAVQLIQLFSGLPGVISAAASALAQFAWGQFGASATAAFQQMLGGFQMMGSAIATFVGSLAGIAWDAISGAGVAAWNAIVGAVGQAGEAIATFVSSLTGVVWDAISGAGVAAWDAITGAIKEAGTAIATFVSSLGSIVWDAISGAGVAAWNALTGAIQNAIAALLRFIGLKSSSGAEAPAAAGGGGFASGGFIRGPGTATSDSIPAWLSRGEFVINAAAVKYFGRGFFAALNSFRMPAGAFSGGGGFAAGGSAGDEPGSLGPQGRKDLAGLLKEVATKVDQNAVELFDSLAQLSIELGGKLDQIAKTLHNTLSELAREIASRLQQIANAIETQANKLIQMIEQAMARVEQAQDAAAAAGAKGLAGGLGSVLNALGSMSGTVKQNTSDMVNGLAQLSDTLGQKLDQIAQTHGDSLSRLASEISQSLQGIAHTVKEEAISVISMIERVWEKLSSNARGGLLGGRGSGTSDSNLAWVSRGEHIMPARAVAQPGVLAFLEALRRSGGNLRAVLDGMGRFALGGLVPRPALAFASGGLAGGMHPVTIQFPGLDPISGLRASSAAIDELRKAAAMAQVRSGGRKPSRYS